MWWFSVILKIILNFDIFQDVTEVRNSNFMTTNKCPSSIR